MLYMMMEEMVMIFFDLVDIKVMVFIVRIKILLDDFKIFFVIRGVIKFVKS